MKKGNGDVGLVVYLMLLLTIIRHVSANVSSHTHGHVFKEWRELFFLANIFLGIIIVCRYNCNYSNCWYYFKHHTLKNLYNTISVGHLMNWGVRMEKYGYFGSLKINSKLFIHAVHFTLNCFVHLVTMYGFSNCC